MTRRGLAVGLASMLAAVIPGGDAHAQSPFDPSATPGSMTPSSLPAPPQPKGGPSPQQQLDLGGAASGGERPSQLPTQQAQLPEDPNAIPPELAPKLTSDFDPEAVEQSRSRTTNYKFFGGYYEEQSGGYRFRTTVPPLWMERTQLVPGGVDRASLYGLGYYNRRSPRHDADILFPLFWRFRDDQTHTTVVGPVAHREGPEGHDNWVAPLFFEGSRKDGSSYLHIPPLLTFHQRDRDGGFSMAGPAFCSWEGSSFCDGRTSRKLDMGVAPLYFYGRDEEREYEVIPPLLHYYRYSQRGEKLLDIWGPYWREKDRNGGSINVAPLFFHGWSERGTRTTVLPFFHHSTMDGDRLLATPLFLDRHGADGSHTFATYLYARYRGRTELDMFSPLVWLYRDPDIQQESVTVLPFFHKNRSNRSDDLVAFPFYGRFKRHGLYDSMWLTPFFNYETNVSGWSTKLLPLVYAGRENDSTHLVVAPLVFDFASPRSRQTVVFPFFWRFADPKGTTQVIGNTFYFEEKTPKGTDWQFHLFPLLSFGANPEGHFWNVLYGLAGYTREGTMAKMRIGYVPIELSKKER
ncbi:MAG: hypothetical protein FJ096_08270 [Deltaproteobacteria bacterium]|nr:hypothetical protein [Deltaproteobacteria bacterium]